MIIWQGTGALILGAALLPFLNIFIAFIFVGSDSLCKWDKYAISLPISKKRIVASRYLSCCLISSVFFLFYLVLNIGAYFWFQDHSIFVHLAAAFIGLGVSLFSVFYSCRPATLMVMKGWGLSW
jgi:ABC-type transport system involved in multi-copper enzyme maturation permease subunit